MKVLLSSFYANFQCRISSSDVGVLSFIVQWALACATNRHVAKYPRNEALINILKWSQLSFFSFLVALFAIQCDYFVSCDGLLTEKALNELAGLTVGM